MRFGILVASLAATLAAFGPSNLAAAPIVFFGENLTAGGAVTGAPLAAHNEFVAVLNGATTETFESLSGSGSFFFSFNGGSGPIDTTLDSLDPNAPATIASAPFQGLFATSGTNFLVSAAEIQFLFSSPVSAFGFYGTDMGDVGGKYVANFFTAAGDVTSIEIPSTVTGPPGSAAGALVFFGVIDRESSWQSITIRRATPTPRDVFGMDDLIVADASQIVPEPISGVLAAIGVFGLAAAQFRGKRQSQTTAS